MAKKSRRLPGGKVRKPLAQRTRSTAPDAPGAVGLATIADEESDDELLDVADEAVEAPPPALRPSPRVATSPAVPARPAAMPAARPATSDPRRVGVGARRTATGAAVPRRSTALMELAAANYSHIRSDLARIGILAVVMLAIIIALSFVLK